MHEEPTRWRIPFIARGAYSVTGGHAYVLGIKLGWLPVQSWRPTGIFEIDLFRVLAFRWADNGFQWSLAKLELSHAFRPATFRWGERELTSQRRASRKRVLRVIANLSK